VTLKEEPLLLATTIYYLPMSRLVGGATTARPTAALLVRFQAGPIMRMPWTRFTAAKK
jgi:hypothetical protein